MFYPDVAGEWYPVGLTCHSCHKEHSAWWIDEFPSRRPKSVVALNGSQKIPKKEFRFCRNCKQARWFIPSLFKLVVTKEDIPKWTSIFSGTKLRTPKFVEISDDPRNLLDNEG